MTAQTMGPRPGQPEPKPHYLGLLNAVCLAEGEAQRYFKAWADTTTDPEVKWVLNFVSEREGSHSRVMRQRIERMGFTVRPKDDPMAEERRKIYGDSALSDMDKLRWKMQRDGMTDYGIDDSFAFVHEKLADASVDELTKNTLRWYLNEELDTSALLRPCFAAIEKRHAATLTPV